MMPTVVDYGKRAVTISRSGFGLCLILLFGVWGCAPQLLGPTSPSGYRFAVISPISVVQGKSAEIVVRVQDAQGQKVDGVTVSFQVAPSQANNASVTPTRTITRGGLARTIFQAGIIGVVRIWVQVENTPHKWNIVVDPRPSPPSGA